MVLLSVLMDYFLFYKFITSCIMLCLNNKFFPFFSKYLLELFISFSSFFFNKVSTACMLSYDGFFRLNNYCISKITKYRKTHQNSCSGFPSLSVIGRCSPVSTLDRMLENLPKVPPIRVSIRIFGNY
jgi:hypothetical protein